MSDSQERIYNEIWDEHVVAVRSFCYAKLSGRPEDAEDMLMSAFGLLWKKIVTDDVPPNPKAWLLATVNNLSFTEYRHTEKDKNNLTYAPLDETVTLYYLVDDIADVLEKEEWNTELWNILLEDLNNEERYILKCDTVDDIPQAQIAEMIGKNHGSTKAQIFRLKRKVKLLKKEKEKIF